MQLSHSATRRRRQINSFRPPVRHGDRPAGYTLRVHERPGPTHRPNSAAQGSPFSVTHGPDSIETNPIRVSVISPYLPGKQSRYTPRLHPFNLTGLPPLFSVVFHPLPPCRRSLRLPGIRLRTIPFLSLRLPPMDRRGNLFTSEGAPRFNPIATATPATAGPPRRTNLKISAELRSSHR